jgi:hypothetical protein
MILSITMYKPDTHRNANGCYAQCCYVMANVVLLNVVASSLVVIFLNYKSAKFYCSCLRKCSVLFFLKMEGVVFTKILIGFFENLEKSYELLKNHLRTSNKLLINFVEIHISFFKKFLRTSNKLLINFVEIHISFLKSF